MRLGLKLYKRGVMNSLRSQISGLLLRNSVHSASTTRCTQGYQTLFLTVIEGVACKTTPDVDSIAERLLLTQHRGAHHIECARPRIVYGVV